MRSRGGFTLMELLVVLAIAGIVMTMVIPSISRSMAQTRVQRAASVVGSDLQYAYSMAARRRAPVRITVDEANKVLRVLNYASPDTTFNERWFSLDGEYPVQTLESDPATLYVYPNGLASQDMTITLNAAGQTRVIEMNRAGQVRVSEE